MKILVSYNAVDGDDNSNLMLGLQQAKAFNCEVVVITSLMINHKAHSFESHVKDDATKRLSEAKDFLEKAGIQCRTELLIQGNSPGEDIVQYARDKQIDLIIIGVRIRSRVGKLLLGSTAQYVILNAHCPVLVTNSKNQKDRL